MALKDFSPFSLTPLLLLLLLPLLSHATKSPKSHDKKYHPSIFSGTFRDVTRVITSKASKTSKNTSNNLVF
jgi:hypothetical protein